jgi:single-strand DNA-binding protein
MLKMQAIGLLGKDATISEYNSKKVINFDIAITEKWKDAQGNTKERTTWVNCSWWTERLGIVEYLKKGSHIYVEGTPTTNAYVDKQGKPGASLVCRVAQMQLLRSTAPKADQNNAVNAAAAPLSMAPDTPPTPADDLPF